MGCGEAFLFWGIPSCNYLGRYFSVEKALLSCQGKEHEVQENIKIFLIL